MKKKKNTLLSLAHILRSRISHIGKFEVITMSMFSVHN